MIKWINLIRWPNLLIIAITQVAIFYKYFKPLALIPSNEILQKNLNIVLLIVCTILVAISGYIINDLFDQSNDKINKKKSKQIIGKTISQEDAIFFYLFVVILGNILAIYLTIQFNLFYSYIIYPISIFIFWYYSYQLKCLPLIGNILVSAFIGVVILLLPYSFHESLFLLKEQDFANYKLIMSDLIAMSIFAFLINLFREIIKDIEDYNGDQACICKSTAVYFGIQKTWNIAQLVLLGLFLFSLFFMFYILEQSVDGTFILMVMTPILILVYLTLIKKETHITQISLISKFYMILGLLYFLLQ